MIAIAAAILLVGFAFVGVVFYLGREWIRAYREDVRGVEERADEAESKEKERAYSLDDLDPEEQKEIVDFVRYGVDAMAEAQIEEWKDELRAQGLEDEEIEARLRNREPIVVL